MKHAESKSTPDIVVYAVAISSCFLLLMCFLSSCFSIVVICQSKVNAKLKADLATERASKLYEEINLEDYVRNIDSNIAYDHVSEKQLSQCTH